MLDDLKNICKNIYAPIKKWQNNLETDRLARVEKKLGNAKSRLLLVLPEFKDSAKTWDKTLSLTSEQVDKVKDSLSHEDIDVLCENKILNIKSDKGPKEIFYNFFGMDDTWPLKRNLLGIFMVHCPEYPTYFIPSFTQAKATGEAKDLKKGEGPRGLITGGLEGIAVGALVSGKVLKPKEMIPYIGLGAGLQMISCTVFPWLGEKVGKKVYNDRIAEEDSWIQKEEVNFSGKPSPFAQFSNSNTNSTPYSTTYNKTFSGRLKI